MKTKNPPIISLILFLLFQFGMQTYVVAQNKVNVYGRVDSTTQPLIVYYSIDGLKTVGSMRTNNSGVFNHVVEVADSKLEYKCWVQKCDSQSYDSSTLYWTTDSTFSSILPRLTYCDAVSGCDARITFMGFTSAWNGLVIVQGTSNGKNLRRTWDMGDGTLKYGKDSVHHKYMVQGTYRIKFFVEDTITGCIDSSFVTIIRGDGGYSNCLANFIDSKDTSDWTNIIVREYSSGTNLNFHWDFGDGTTSNLREPSHTYQEFGKYLLCLTVSNDSCSNKICRYIGMDSLGRMYKNGKFTINVESSNVGLKNVTNTKNIRIYPNPSKGMFIIENPRIQASMVSITDITGKEITFDSVETENGVQVDLSNAGIGMYFVTLRYGGELAVGRVMVE